MLPCRRSGKHYRYRTVQYSKEQYSAVQCKVQYTTGSGKHYRYITEQYSTVKNNIVQFSVKYSILRGMYTLRGIVLLGGNVLLQVQYNGL